MSNRTPLIVALDFSDQAAAMRLVEQLDPRHCRLKVGKQMFTRFGPAWVEKLQQAGFEVFLDLKFHDIPNTVFEACRAAVDLGVWMVNVHALGGPRMLEAAQKAMVHATGAVPHLIAVTVLTSHSPDELQALGLPEPATLGPQLAAMTQAAGLGGVVCSAHEAQAIKQTCGADFLTVCPGIRLPEDDKGDQRRLMAPAEALAAGADYLVMGRSITQASDPAARVADILSRLEA